MDCYLSPEQIGLHGFEVLRAARDKRASATFYIVATFCLVSDGSLTEHGAKMLNLCENFFGRTAETAPSRT